MNRPLTTGDAFLIQRTAHVAKDVQEVLTKYEVAVPPQMEIMKHFYEVMLTDLAQEYGVTVDELIEAYKAAVTFDPTKEKSDGSQ